MGLPTQNPAANEAHRVREFDQAGERVYREYKEKQPAAQDRLIKSAREQFRIHVRDFGGIAKSEIRVFALDGLGNWRPTPKAVVIGRGAIAEVIAGLCEAEARL